MMLKKSSFTDRRLGFGILLASIGLFLLLGPGVLGPAAVWAQSGGMDDEQAQRHLELGRVFEDAGEWDLALREYGAAAQAESDDLAEQARQGIDRVLSEKNSIVARFQSELDKFWLWFTGNLLKLFAIIITFLLLVRVLLFFTDRRSWWTVIPFKDSTQNELGEAVSESVVSVMHQARLIHLGTSAGTLNISEEIDLPSFGAPTLKEAQSQSLKALDTLDVSGIGLPLGSMLAGIVRWIDMGQHHILGSIQQRGQNLCLSAQLRRGRAAGSSKVWTLTAPLDQDDFSSTLSELEQDLAFQILFDIQEGWGASTSTSLRLFTEALQCMQLAQTRPTGQKQALQEAAELLKKALSEDPVYAAAKYNLALVYHNLGQYQQAIILLSSLRLQPKHNLELELAYNLGAAYYHTLTYSAYDLAEKEFRYVVNAMPDLNLPERSREIKALAYCGLISVYAQKMHHDKKNRDEYFRQVQECFAALDLERQEPSIAAIAHTALGMALLNHRETKAAVAMFREAVRLKPDYWRTYIHWGRAEMAKRDFDSAAICLLQALAINPDYEFAHYQLGVALKRAKKYDQAAEALSRAPNIPHAHNELGHIMAESRQDYEAALAKFEESLVLKPGLVDAMVNIAWYTLEADYQDDEHLDRALQCAQQAADLEPESWHRHSVLGRVYLAKGQLEEAKGELEKAIQLDRRASQSYFFLANTCVELGELEEAEKALEKFLQRSHRSSWHKKARQDASALRKEIKSRLRESN